MVDNGLIRHHLAVATTVENHQLVTVSEVERDRFPSIAFGNVPDLEAKTVLALTSHLEVILLAEVYLLNLLVTQVRE